MGVQAKNRGCTTSDRYAEAMERALGLTRLPTPGQMRRTLLPGGCILYHVPLQRWHRNRH